MRLSTLIVLTGLEAFVAASCGNGGGGTTNPPPPTDATPPASAGHNLVYAADQDMVLLVNSGLGGSNGPAVTARTRVWGWNGERWRLLDSAGPPVRNLAGAAYDSRRRVLVMHGGSYDLSHMYGETWEWSPTSGWRQFTGTTPGVRDHTQMAFDSERGRVVVFGGSATTESAFADTWEFDGTRWERFTAAGPAGRVHHALQYDPVARAVVAFGGFAPRGAEFGDTWAWDGTRWSRIAQDVAPRTHARMAFHDRLGALMLIGGIGGGTGIAPLERRGTSWLPNAATPTPSARYLPDVAYDTKRGVLVLFGGGDPAGTTLFADTWEFDATTWRRK